LVKESSDQETNISLPSFGDEKHSKRKNKDKKDNLRAKESKDLPENIAKGYSSTILIIKIKLIL
jgi:hypothetical protein